MTSTLLNRVADRMGQRQADPRLRWRETARPDQLLPEGDWRVWYVQGGRGGGKTRSGAQGLADWLLSDPDDEGEYGIVAPTYADAWTKCVEGESGLLRALGTSMKEVKAHTSRTVKNAWRTYGQVILHSGLVVYIDSAAEGGLRIQGRNLKGIWCDEIGLWLNWETAWNESIRYAVRMGISRIIATATPKASRPARKLIRSLIKNDKQHGGVVITKLRTIDNAANLSDAFLAAVVGAAEGTRLERQELEGELLDDVANALWTRDLLEGIQVPDVGEEGGPPYLRNCVIGVDPSDGNETSDEQAYTVIGEGLVDDGKIYVAESWGGQMAPAQFARLVIKRALAWNAAIVVEKNHGGEWLKATFVQVMKDMQEEGLFKEGRPPLRMIHASQAKRTRAEPVSALYERDIVRHCQRMTRRPCDCKDKIHKAGHLVPDTNLPELEDQMATFTGAAGERSPDRLDSLVWAATPWLKKTFGKPPKGGVRQWAAKAELEAVGGRPPSRAGRRLAQAHNGVYSDADKAWDLDDFAPRGQEDEAVPAGKHGNIRSWR
jgi:predicted phage terminase large subunit-like protein